MLMKVRILHLPIMKALTLLPALSLSSSCLFFLLVSTLCSVCFCNRNSDSVQCIPTERLALIDLKSNLSDEANRLSSWVGHDCCSWLGVVCDNITGHVHEIHLRGHCDDEDAEDEQMLSGTISPSLIKLSQLRYLDLSCNDFGFSSIPTSIGYFQNLIYLNLSYSGFSGEIPHQLGNLSTLQVLDLQGELYIDLIYSKSLAWLKNFKRLQYLDMGGTSLTKASDWFPVVSNLTSLLELHFSRCELNLLPSHSTAVSLMPLVALDLSYNTFGNIMPEWIFSLRNLAYLDLNLCYISGVNPGTHGGFHSMPSLRTLLLSRNTFVNSSPLLNGLSSLRNLRRLDVSECDISSPVVGKLKNLPSIEYVDLSSNDIVEEIPKSLSNLCNITILGLGSNKFSGNVSELLERFCECESPKLEALDFSDNYLVGQLLERLGKLENLIYIDLSSNQLAGSIPDSLGSLSLLETLDLSNNKLNGSLPESIGRLSKLCDLSLEDNSLIGILTETHFANLTDLTRLSIGDNKLVFKLNAKNWTPRFQLTTLIASSCNLGPQFPSWIRSQLDLRWLVASNANISDTIPNWFWTTIFPNLSYLNISHNNIQGKLGDVTAPEQESVIDLSNNHLHGRLPGNFSTTIFLDLSNNILSGSLEQFLCSGIQEPRPLKFLNLANNNMSGVISDCWMNWHHLLILNLEKNQFNGIIPSSLGNISSLRSLELDYNRLSGKLPPWLLNSTRLVVIKLAENELIGKMPSSIGRNNTHLRVLSLRSNNLEGKIPKEICHLRSVQILDLAHNDLSGNLPTCFTNFSVISGSKISRPIVVYETTIITASLVTKGNTYTYGTILYQVTSLDLSSNKFSGSIPDELVALSGLRFLNLSHNALTGTIPNSFSQNGTLESLDLSMNHLEGNIPLSLSQLTTLNCLNISYNNLVGRIPIGPQFQTFDELSFIGNALCGGPLPACLENNGDPKSTTHGHGESNRIDWILVIFTLVGLVVGFWIILAPLFLSRRWRIAYYRFLKEIWFKIQEFIFLLFLRLTRRFRTR